MNFLDESGLKKLLAKIKASFGTAIVNSSSYITELDNEGHANIPFVTNHQIVLIDAQRSINVYNWFQKASRGGILEATFAGDFLTVLIFCKSNNGISFLYQVKVIQSKPVFSNINFLSTNFSNYIRLIKKDDNTLVIAEFIQNKQN